MDLTTGRGTEKTRVVVCLEPKEPATVVFMNGVNWEMILDTRSTLLSLFGTGNGLGAGLGGAGLATAITFFTGLALIETNPS